MIHHTSWVLENILTANMSTRLGQGKRQPEDTEELSARLRLENSRLESMALFQELDWMSSWLVS